MPKDLTWLLAFVAGFACALLFLRLRRPVRRRARRAGGAKVIPLPRHPWERARLRKSG